MYREQIDAYLDGKQEEILQDLVMLMKIPSIRGEAQEGKPYGEEPARVLEAAMGLMERYGLKVRNYDNYVVTGDFGEGEKELDILAHLDVVPVTEDWTVTQPFTPLIADGKIYGRGSADDKGPAIAALYAIRAIKELNIPLKKSLRLILGSDEECGSSDLEYYYSIEQEAPWSFTPDADFPLINIEKGRLAKSFEKTYEVEEAVPGLVSIRAGEKVNVVPGKAQALVTGLSVDEIRPVAEQIADQTHTQITLLNEQDGVQIQVKGTAAHGSTPELGINSLTTLLLVLQALPLCRTQALTSALDLLELFPHGDTCGEALGVKMADLKTGALSSNFAILELEDGHIHGEFDMRAPLCATDENLTQVVREALAKKGYEMEAGNASAAHYVPADSPFVQTLLASYERYFGQKGEPLSTGGGTYVHDLKRGVAFGCMSEDVDNHMHGDDEFMVIERLMTSAKIFADAIVRICG